jgi:hypothetical protein
LRNAARESQTSLSTLVNQIIRSYTEWEISSAKSGHIVFQKDTLKEVFAAMDEDTISRIARHTAHSTIDIMLLMMGDATLNEYLTLLRRRAKRSGFDMHEHYEQTSKIRRIVIKHEMGRKYSLFCKEQIEATVQALGCNRARVDFTNDTMILSIVVDTEYTHLENVATLRKTHNDLI